MSDRTNNFSLPLIYQNQSQKEILINESLTILDGILAKGAISKSIATPPALPDNGDLYIVAASSTGVWAGKDLQIAYYITGWGWQFYEPQEGFTIRVNDEKKLYSYTIEDGWVSAENLQNIDMLGVNATADTTNRLSVSSSAILFNREVDDIQVKVNKQAAGDNASFLFQTNYSGRAEIGLTGDDDFHFKVSPDGSTWFDAITIDKDTGNVTLTGGGGGGGSWGSITGTLSSQTDLQSALDGKVDKNSAITGATKTKITYDSKGLVTSGADATTADISDSTNKRYVTDAQLTVIGNTSGTNTGDQASIVGIAGTKAQFDTACTDGNFLYVGDITQYTDEMAQDAVGAMIDSSLNYVDGTPLLQRAALTGDITASAGSNATTIANNAVISSKLGTTATYESVSLTPSADQNNYSTGVTLTNASILGEIRIAPTNSIIVTGIDAISVVNGKKITIKNTTVFSASTARMILIPRESTSSTAANRFNYPATGVPIILMPGDSTTFVYNTTTSRWEFDSGSRCGNPRSFFDMFADFAGDGSQTTTTASGTGSGGANSTVTVADATQKALGLFAAGTGTTTTGYCFVGSSSSPFKGGSGAALHLSRVAPEVLSDGTNTYTAQIGFHDGAGTGTVVDGVYWEYDQATSTAWRTCTASNSTFTKNTVTGFTVSITVLHSLGIFINGDWTNVEYFYSSNGVDWTIFSTQITTNIPTSTARLFGQGFGIKKSAGTTSRFLDADFIGYRYDAIRGS